MRGRILSAAEAAETLGLSGQRVRQLIAEGRLKAFGVGRGWALYESDVRQFAAKPRPSGRPTAKKQGPP